VSKYKLSFESTVILTFDVKATFVLSNEKDLILKNYFILLN
jgi:hypothetical protein